MDENQKSIDGVIEKLALISDGAQTLFPNGKSVIIFELPENDFAKVQRNFRDVDRVHKQFKIDMSGVEIVFVLDGTLKQNETIKEPENKLGFWKKLFSRIGGKSSIKN
jgi:hypothetical protein